MYANKIAVVILTDLADWQKLNVTVLLASSVATYFPETHGAPLVSDTGTAYLPFLKHPILVYAADSGEQIKRAFSRAAERQVHLGIYTRDLFETKNEDGNLAAIAKHTDTDLDLVGLSSTEKIKKVDKAVDKLKFHA